MVLLLFYPGDETTVCTKQFCAYRDAVFIVDEEGRIAHKHANPLSLTFDGVEDLRAALAKVPAGASHG